MKTTNLIRVESTAHDALARAVCRQFVESPHLALTLDQAAARFRLAHDTCGRVLSQLVNEGALTLERCAYRLTLNGRRTARESRGE